MLCSPLIADEVQEKKKETSNKQQDFEYKIESKKNNICIEVATSVSISVLLNVLNSR